MKWKASGRVVNVIVLSTVPVWEETFFEYDMVKVSGDEREKG